jgi:hypothetical protein
VKDSLNWICVFRLLRVWGRPAVAILSCACLAGEIATAATISRKLFVSFDGTLSVGNTYTLGPGELDVTGTFRKNGSATIAGGVADIPGNVNSTSGFLFDGVSLGSLTTQNWVTEAVLLADVPATSQPGTFNHFLDVQGDLYFRYSSNGQPKTVQYGFWDGSSEPRDNTSDLSTSQYSHVALVWNGSSRTLQGFINGVSQGTLSTGNAFAIPSTNVGYGFFARSGFMNRAFDGKLASVAFSTYTGVFNPGFGTGFDFQLDPSGTPALSLTLEVNTVSGRTSIVNNTAEPISIQGYELSSELGSLDVSATGWWSLMDQELEPVSGGDGPGETWQEGGQPTSESLLEVFLLGNTTLQPGTSLALGKAYDALLDARDLEFRYRLAGQSGVLTGTVDYDQTPQVFGDYDNDLDVDGRDFLVWQRSLDTTTSLPNDRTPGTVTSTDLVDWQANYGASIGAPLAPLGSVTVPEPAAAVLMLMLLLDGNQLRQQSRIGHCRLDQDGRSRRCCN